MKYELVNLEEMTVSGKSIRTTNENNKAMNDIGLAWQEFIGEGVYDSIKNKIDAKAIALYYDYEGDMTGSYSFMCGTRVNDKNNEQDNVIVPASKYAKVTMKGNMVIAVAKAWGEIWKMELDRKYTFDFEVYHNDSEDMDNQTIDIYIAIN